jgi:hypothetical protein
VIVQAIGASAIIVSLLGLYLGVHQFNEQQQSTAAQNLDQQRQATLSGYLDDMSALVLQYKLSSPKSGAAVRAIAVARTLTAVRNLDGDRKGTLIRYLWEADLIIGPHPILDLSGADLNEAVFAGAVLNQINLSGLLLNGADLLGAHLDGADLAGSLLIGSHLQQASLECLDVKGGILRSICADLQGTYLTGADLAGADLIGADLAGADLVGADLSGTRLSGADLNGARYNGKPIHATNAQGDPVIEGPTRWPGGFNPKAAGAECLNC